MNYDILIIGGGPGGYVAAIRAAQLGAKVGVVEKDTLGGTCLNRGCIPTKTLLTSAFLVKQLANASELGINVEGFTIDFPRVMARKDQVVQQLVKGIHFLFKKNKVDLIPGHGRIFSPGRLEVMNNGETREVTAKHIIIATGSEPALIKSLGYDGSTVVTSTEALCFTEQPKSILIIGGGVIGCEFATLFHYLGTKVTVVEAMPSILPMIDKEVARTAQSYLKRSGIDIKTGATIQEVTTGTGGVTASLENGERLHAEKALISIGRTFNTSDLGLEDAGVQLGPKGEVLVDDYLATNVKGIYAIGDVTGKVLLAHLASAQGTRVVENILRGPVPMDYHNVPHAIFTMPEIAGIGLTSQEAEEQGRKIKVGKFPFMASGRALAAGEKEGFVKVIADQDTGRILGVQIIGPHATDLIAEAGLALQVGGTIHDIATTIHAHPTLAECLKEAAEGAAGQAIHI